MGTGGAERVTANLTQYWAQKGWDITIVTLAPRSLDFYPLHPSIKRIALELAGDSRNMITGFKRNYRRIFELRRVLRRIKPDIALSMMTEANVLLALAAFGLPGIGTVGAERSYPPKVPLGTIWKKLRCYTYRMFSAVTVLTHDCEEWIKSHTYAQKITVIPNAAIYPLPAQAYRIAPCATERKLLLAVGSLEIEKGFDLLIKSFAILSETYPDWDLSILGEGSLRPALETQIQNLGLEKRIELPGRVGNIGEWYEHAELFVLCSRFEGFPNALIEAMAYGLPVVSFDCDTGPRDIIRHQVDGLLVPAGETAALTATLNTLMSDKALRAQLAARAAEVKTRFSMQNIAGLWEQLFAELLSKPY